MNRYMVNYATAMHIVLKALALCHHEGEISEERAVLGNSADTGNMGRCAGTKLCMAIQDLCGCKHKFCTVWRKVWESNSVSSQYFE